MCAHTHHPFFNSLTQESGFTHAHTSDSASTNCTIWLPLHPQWREGAGMTHTLQLCLPVGFPAIHTSLQTQTTHLVSHGFPSSSHMHQCMALPLTLYCLHKMTRAAPHHSHPAQYTTPTQHSTPLPPSTSHHSHPAQYTTPTQHSTSPCTPRGAGCGNQVEREE